MDIAYITIHYINITFSNLAEAFIQSELTNDDKTEAIKTNKIPIITSAMTIYGTISVID